MKPSSRITIGLYRPIYLWAGPGTVRMNRLKFLDVAVDEVVHREAHTPQGVKRVLEEMHCNWVHLMYNWGFPPEVEREDWESFARGAAAYHDGGSQVLAYIQTSNCVRDGSFQDKDWYALDSRGKPIPYMTYRPRYMTCLDHPEWKENLKQLIKGAIERGADGIFFDNTFQGQQALSMAGAWMEMVGCHCPHCQQAYGKETGTSIPTELDTTSPDVMRYLRWRADQVTDLLAEMKAYANSLQPATPISANVYDAVMRNAYLSFGIDAQRLADVLDIAMVENFGLPAWEDKAPPRLANNALTIRTTRPLVRDAAHLSVLSYDVGIGFDPAYPPRRYQQGIAEALACGASMTTKGTEYFDDGKMTLLTAPQYSAARQAIGAYHMWLEANARLFAGERRSLAPVGLLFPEKTLWLDWLRLAGPYFGAGQTLTLGGVPWRVVRRGDRVSDLQALLVFEDAKAAASLTLPQDTRIVPVLELEHWRPPPPSIVARNQTLRSIVAHSVGVAIDIYGKNKLARRTMDGLGLQKIVTQSPFYHVPEARARKSLLDALPDGLCPRVESKAPVLIEVWQGAEGIQVHLANYAQEPQSVRVLFDAPVSARVISPEAEESRMEAEEMAIEIPLDVYSILLVSQE